MSIRPIAFSGERTCNEGDSWTCKNNLIWNLIYEMEQTHHHSARI